MATPAQIEDVRRLAQADHGLAVVSTLRQGSSSIQSSVVNAGVLEHPITGKMAVGFVVEAIPSS